MKMSLERILVVKSKINPRDCKHNFQPREIHDSLWEYEEECIKCGTYKSVTVSYKYLYPEE